MDGIISNTDYNALIPIRYRKRLNRQNNILKLDTSYNGNDHIIQPYRYVIGLGEKHYRLFDHVIIRLTEVFPWTKKKHIRFIMNELILNSQFSMLREIIKKVPLKKKVPAYFYVTIYINKSFISAGIEEFGDFFDYYTYIDGFNSFIDENKTFEDYYDDKNEMTVKGLNDLADNKLKLVLTADNRLMVPDDSNKIGLNLIENATDNDFYIVSFYKNGKYMWKRIYFRIENG